MDNLKADYARRLLDLVEAMDEPLSRTQPVSDPELIVRWCKAKTLSHELRREIYAIYKAYHDSPKYRYNNERQ